jgi:urease accessory protein
VHMEIDVGPGCTVEIEDVGGTVAYRGARSSWILDVAIGAGGMLLWHGLPFVVTDGADAERRTRITLGPDARAVIRETLVLGRHGEEGGRLASVLAVSDSGGPILMERLEAAGGAPEPGVLGSNRVVDAVIAVGFRPPPRAGDLEFDRPGSMARHLSDHTHGSPLDRVWDAWVFNAQERPFTPEPERTRIDSTAR